MTTSSPTSAPPPSSAPTKKVARVHSPCECEAQLGAELDEERTVLRGWAKDARGRERPAPATALVRDQHAFDVGWSCPFCIRNVLRTFDASALPFRSIAPAR